LTAANKRSILRGVPPVYFVSLGCPKNRVDTEVMLGLSQSAGYPLTEDPADAEVIVVNTCGFIGAAKEESVDTILEMAAYKTQGRCRRLVVTGCLSQRYPDELLREIPEIDHLLGSGEVDKIAAAIRGSAESSAEAGPVVDVAAVPKYIYDHDAPRPASQAFFSRYVKIAEGCDRPCGFCIIPKLRGPQRSRSMDSIATEVERLSREGVVEVNLVAQDLTTYGTDLPYDVDRGAARPSLANLLRRIGTPALLSDPGSLRWIRLHYAYPTAVTDELLDVIAESPRVAKYLDVPLQHADDRLLKLMRRGHVGKTVWSLVERARKRIPDINLRTTFIVGHPGETEEAFTRLCEFVRQARFDHVGAFCYSSEEGTHSATLAEAVPAKEAERRRRELLRLQRSISKQKQRAMRGRHIEVLVEGASDESEYLLQGRHAGQAPEIDGRVYLSLGDACAELLLRPGDLVNALVTSSADYDLSATVTAVAQPAYRPPQAVKLRVVS
jgi:ribosomal protein S12 methylthiotransferase